MLKQDIMRTANMIQGGTIKKIIGCFRSPGVHAAFIYRFGAKLYECNRFFNIVLMPLFVFLFYRIRTKWGIEIQRDATIDEGLYIGHHGGIVISGGAVIGKNVNISQNVTIGVSGEGENRGCPVIGDNVYIAPGAKIFGKITIGNNVKIGANAVVFKDIPENAIVVLEPGYKIVSYKGNLQN